MTLVCLVFAGCNKEKEDIDFTAQPGDEAPEKGGEAPKSSKRVKATITYQGLSIFDAAEDGNWMKTVDMGDVVYIISDIPKGKDNWRPVEIELQD